MSTIKLKGNSINTIGNLPKEGDKAPNFELLAVDLSTKKLSDYKGKKLILNIFPSVDTGTCAMSVREFNEKAADYTDTTVLCISRDLPFAQKRFCGASNIENVEMLSDFKDGKFGKDFGLIITDGPMAGLLSRCVILLDEDQNVIYTQQVEEITEEPNYEEVYSNLK